MQQYYLFEQLSPGYVLTLLSSCVSELWHSPNHTIGKAIIHRIDPWGWLQGISENIMYRYAIKKNALKCRESSKHKWNFMLLGKSVISIFRNCHFMTKWVTTMYGSVISIFRNCHFMTKWVTTMYGNRSFYNENGVIGHNTRISPAAWHAGHRDTTSLNSDQSILPCWVMSQQCHDGRSCVQ
jgi:hypothetical protein